MAVRRCSPTSSRRSTARWPPARPSTGYGLTETHGIVTANSSRFYLAKPASCGPIVPTLDAKLVDEAGEELPAGPETVGQLCVRGPVVIKGYLNRPEATADAIRDGWFNTGDIARIDEDGFVFIVDRAKDMVLRGGENVYCSEVEAAIYQHDDVAEVAVFGVPDERLGEDVGAVVVLRSGAELDADALRDFLDGRIAKHKIPATVWFRETPLPRNANGKFMKRELRAELLGRRSAVLGGSSRNRTDPPDTIRPDWGATPAAAGVVDVVAELGADGVDAVELALAAQEVLEANLGLLAVQLALEVEQVRLEQRVVGVLVERRPPPEVDRAGVDRAVGPLVAAGVDAVGRQAHRAGHVDVGRREADQPTALVATDDRAAHLVRPAEHPRGELDVAAGQRPPDGRAADRLVDPVRPGDQVDRVDDEVVGEAVVLEQTDVAVAVAAEVEVLADDDRPHGQPLDEHALDERLRRLLRLRLVEAQDHGGVEPGGGQQLEALVGRRQQLRCRLGTHDRGGVTVERQHDRHRIAVGGEALDLLDHRLVPEVHAVVGADRDHGAPARPRWPVELGDHLHGRRRYPGASTTAGFARPPPIGS